ncbi:type II toxin-antitoxin system Phd/YefM family antitoxin [Desulfatirhabdium butyrativorans]|uniref:type II toxin-antitoxin system Phd/YefM family antitoxin n=1 Tax=Desulfatirhabdium butyrativorans TaxID=340467 RepID=UPI000A07086C|nr:type II toxin-antitoxin system prevent-host-death family antitoxin [Desulfatirhabdium butyrativorans]
MKTVSFTEFRKHASNLFSDVENGEMIVVVKHGKPIAQIKPFKEESRKPSWKKPGLRLAINRAQLCSAILEERDHESLS